MTERKRMASCQDPNCHLDREQKMVTVTDERGNYRFHCDPCLVRRIQALNDGGFETIASCCGHGFRPPNIAMKGGIEIFITRYFEEARAIDRLFPIDINGMNVNNECAWMSDDGGSWKTSCGNHFVASFPDPPDNGFIHCPSCGRQLINKERSQ